MRHSPSHNVSLRARGAGLQINANAHFHRFHEIGGAVMVDALGKAGSMTLAAYGTGTPYANAPYITPDGTNHYVQCGADAVLNAVNRLDQPYGHIVKAIDYWFDGSLTGNEQIDFAGTDLGTGGAGGGWGLAINSANQLQLSYRGINATTGSNVIFTGSGGALAANARNTILWELVYLTPSTVLANLYVNGAIKSTIASVDLLANSATAPYGSVQVANGSVQGYSVGAMPTGTSTRSRLGNSAGSSCRFDHWFGYKSAVADATLAARLALELYRYPGEVPRALNGKDGTN